MKFFDSFYGLNSMKPKSPDHWCEKVVFHNLEGGCVQNQLCNIFGTGSLFWDLRVLEQTGWVVASSARTVFSKIKLCFMLNSANGWNSSFEFWTNFQHHMFPEYYFVLFRFLFSFFLLFKISWWRLSRPCNKTWLIMAMVLVWWI